MKKIGIIGLGSMGASISARLGKDFKIVGFDKASQLENIAKTDIIIIAVKPQAFVSLSSSLKKYINDQYVISVMAGVKANTISRHLDTPAVMRTMPNLALAEGKSLTAAYCIEQPESTAKDILAVWGETVWLEDEAMFDSFTALCGSGPAYFLELARQIRYIAEKAGYDKKTAKAIAGNALQSASLLLEAGEIEDKINRISSKGGVTQAAFSILNKSGFKKIIKKAIDAGINRSKELSK